MMSSLCYCPLLSIPSYDHRQWWRTNGKHHALVHPLEMLKSGSDETDEVKFLQEAAIMGQFKHPNVIKLHGVVTVGKPVSVAHCINV